MVWINDGSPRQCMGKTHKSWRCQRSGHYRIRRGAWLCWQHEEAFEIHSEIAERTIEGLRVNP